MRHDKAMLNPNLIFFCFLFFWIVLFVFYYFSNNGIEISDDLLTSTPENIFIGDATIGYADEDEKHDSFSYKQF